MHGAKNAYNCYWFLLQKTWKIMTRYGDIFLNFFYKSVDIFLLTYNFME